MVSRIPPLLAPWAATLAVLSVLGILGTLAPGCSYRLQRSHQGSVLTQKGVRRIYIAPMVNQTYKPGVDHVVFNELQRAIAMYDQVRIVRNITDADAVLKGTVSTATYGPSATTFASSIFPPGVGASDIPVATEYVATLVCGFALVQQPHSPELKMKGSIVEPKQEILPGPVSGLGPTSEAGTVAGAPEVSGGNTITNYTGSSSPIGGPKVSFAEKVLWSSSFARSRPFPANNQIGAFGTTSALINESEFDRSLKDMAESMMADVNEAMFAMF